MSEMGNEKLPPGLESSGALTGVESCRQPEAMEQSHGNLTSYKRSQGQ